MTIRFNNFPVRLSNRSKNAVHPPSQSTSLENEREDMNAALPSFPRLDSLLHWALELKAWG